MADRIVVINPNSTEAVTAAMDRALDLVARGANTPAYEEWRRPTDEARELCYLGLSREKPALPPYNQVRGGGPGSSALLPARARSGGLTAGGGIRLGLARPDPPPASPSGGVGGGEPPRQSDRGGRSLPPHCR